MKIIENLLVNVLAILCRIVFILYIIISIPISFAIGTICIFTYWPIYFICTGNGNKPADQIEKVIEKILFFI